MRLPRRLAILSLVGAACDGAAARPAPSPAPAPAAPPAARPAPEPADATAAGAEPALPPAIAYTSGLMPLRSTGVEQFRAKHPTYDGRALPRARPATALHAPAPGLIVTTAASP